MTPKGANVHPTTSALRNPDKEFTRLRRSRTSVALLCFAFHGFFCSFGTADQAVRLSVKPNLLGFLPNSVEICVVDKETGRALGGAFVNTTSDIASFFYPNPQSLNTSGFTNKDGFYTFRENGTLNIKIEMDGYYKFDESWQSRDELPKNPVRIALTPLAPAVSMYRNSIELKRKEAWKDEIRWRIALVPKGSNPLVTADDGITVTDFEIVCVRRGPRFETSPGGEQLVNKDWDVSVIGRNGWLVAAVGAEAGRFDESSAGMRVAPADGYAGEIQYKLDSERGFFLKKGEIGRYGKVFDLRINDISSQKSFEFRLKMHYLVQVNESGSVSLNPKEAIQVQPSH